MWDVVRKLGWFVVIFALFAVGIAFGAMLAALLDTATASVAGPARATERRLLQAWQIRISKGNQYDLCFDLAGEELSEFRRSVRVEYAEPGYTVANPGLGGIQIYATGRANVLGEPSYVGCSQYFQIKGNEWWCNGKYARFDPYLTKFLESLVADREGTAMLRRLKEEAKTSATPEVGCVPQNP